ncbi:MAG: rhodanese-like domain-containing protein [Clostridiales bacterium]|nr:rhodanese-like domain-containing protein [Clostridiales bacterium]
MNNNLRIRKITIIAAIALLVLGCGSIGRSIWLLAYQPSVPSSNISFEKPEENMGNEDDKAVAEKSESGLEEKGNEISAEGTEASQTDADQEAVLENPGYRVISGEDALAMYEANPDEIILLDVRGREEYAMQHVADSIVIPLDELESRLDELPDKKLAIIVFCEDGELSKKAYDILISHGYYNLYDMQKLENWPSHFGSILV